MEQQLSMNDIFDRKTKDRFWKKVHSMQAGECWIWDSATMKTGYGEFHYSGTMMYAHIISYIMYFGPVPEGKLVCHKCDVKRCVNPYHLYAGTYSENLQDKYDRDPNSHRRIFNFSKVSKEDADAMKALRIQGSTYEDIAKHFNVTRQTISNLVNGRTTNFTEV